MKGFTIFTAFLAILSISSASTPALAQTINPVVQEVQLPGSAFAATTTPNGRYVFVSMVAKQGGETNGIAIIRQRKKSASLIRVLDTGADTYGLAITRNGKYLVDTVQRENNSTAPEGVQFIDVRKAIAGKPGALLGTVPTSPVTASSIEVVLSNDDRFVFASNEYDETVSVIDFKKALASGGGPTPIVGAIPVEHAPVGMTISGDGRYLYITNEAALSSDPDYDDKVCTIPQGTGNPPPTAPGPYGTLNVVNVNNAEINPAGAGRVSLYAGCSPTRVLLSQDDKIVWVSARDDNNLLAFSAAAILANAANPLLSTTPVGVAPDGAQPFNHGRYIAVANTNRFYTGQAGTVTILDYSKALNGDGNAATVGTFSAGAFPRQWAISPNGKYLYLTEFGSDVLAVFPVCPLVKDVQ
jgi:DNA-binding beta-propeller fold protein YncE